MLSLIVSVALLQSGRMPTDSPFKASSPLGIRGVSAPSSEVPRYGIEELTVDLSATYDNPFDPEDIALDAKVTSPSGASSDVPGFIYQPFERSQGPETEINTPTGRPIWKIRLCPTELGKYSVDITARDRSGSVSAKALSFQCSPSDDPGFVRVSPRDHHYFEFDDGHTYFPIGANACWGSKGTYDYDLWFPALGKAGANYSRLWLSPGWSTFGLLQTGKSSDGKGAAQFDLANAWRLDYVLSLARKNGLYVMLSLDSYNILRPKDAYPMWEKTPENQDNGGPLRVPTDFWTDPRMEKLYKMKLRYLVARYGADTHVLSWEFWNEVDLTDGFDGSVVGDWHHRMGQELAKTDPYHHLRTTSLANSMGDRRIDLVPELDYVQTHHYGPDPANATVFQQSRKAEDGKPHIVAEIGADSTGPQADKDPTGIQVHDPMWAAISSGCAGTAMSWWWDTLIAPHNLYPLYTAAAKFCAGIDWAGEDFHQADTTFAFATGLAAPVRRDLVFEEGPVDWAASPLNLPKAVRISSRGDVSGGPLAGILHGIRNHPQLHNPVTFNVQLNQPTEFVVEIGAVSGYGGAALTIDLDGDRVMTRNFPDSPANTGHKTLTQYAKAYKLTIPKGHHAIVVSNPGPDWAMVGYRFRNLQLVSGPPLQGWSILGNDTAICWVRLKGRSWRRATSTVPMPAAPPSILGLSGLASGDWKTEVWDTWKGSPVRTLSVRVGLDGKARVSLPRIDRDVAVKMTRISS